MILLLAVRSLLAHPVRSAVLAFGFGLGVSVMATLLGVGDVILEQARTPALAGGGDVIVAGATGHVGSARYVLASVLGTPPLRERVAAASPRGHARLFLVRGSGRGTVPIVATGGVPSRERALGDRESAPVAAWVDAPGDAAWAAPDPADVLRRMDRFHPVPDVPARAASWAEWLYFNGTASGTRFYLTFMIGARRPDGRRPAGVRLQLERAGRTTSFGEAAEVDDAAVQAGAPDLVIGKNRVRLEGLRYHLDLDLPRMDAGSSGDVSTPARATGALTLEAAPGRSLPPLVIRGAFGWVSGYVVPVMAGTLGGALHVGEETIAMEGTGYHDHNWGFWEGVTWQWGQVQQGGLSFVYGRVHPPADAADPERIPGFLAVLGPSGPVGYAADVSIVETNDPGDGRPRRIVVRGRGPSLDLSMDVSVEDAVITRRRPGSFGASMDFLQLRARYRVRGQAGDRHLDFEAPGSAETFRGR
jgi:hypothetical protein